MEGLDNYMSGNTLALLVSGLIFVVTVALVIRNFVSFLITSVLLFFAVVSGMAIANNDIVRGQLGWDQPGTVAKTDSKNPPEESTIESVKAKLVSIYDQLVEILSNHSKEQASSSSGQKSQQLKTSVEHVLEQLDLHREKLQEFLDEHNISEEGPQKPSFG